MDDTTPFTFLDGHGRPFKAQPWGKDGPWWLFYWHEGQKGWVSLRPVDATYLKAWRGRAMSAEDAAKYERGEVGQKPA